MPGAPDPRHHELPREPRARRRAAGAGRPGPRTWGGRHPGLLPVPARLHDPGGAAAELGHHRRPRGHPGDAGRTRPTRPDRSGDRKSTRLNSSHVAISYAVFCLKKKKDTDPNGSYQEDNKNIKEIVIAKD